MILTILAVLLCAVPAAAQTDVPPLTSNRPGIADSEALVGRGIVELEAGVQQAASPPGSDISRDTTWGELTLRVGVTNRFEVWSGWDGLSLDRVNEDGVSRIEAGGNDVRVGVKLAILDEKRHGLTLTLSPAWSFPVGSDRVGSGTEDQSLRLLAARTLPGDWSLGGNAVFTHTSDHARRYWDNGVMLNLSHSVTSAVSAFGEVAGRLIDSQPDAWTIDGGIAWLATRDLQLDLFGGHTLHHRGDVWFVSAGIAIRRRPR